MKILNYTDYSSLIAPQLNTLIYRRVFPAHILNKGFSNQKGLTCICCNFPVKVSSFEQFKLKQHPERMEQYALLGFAPLGTDLKKDFLITLIEET